jgi:hypothetical protein
MSTEWKYILDQMEIETADNVKKAAAISLFHDSALFTMSGSIAGLLPLYNRYHPLHLAFMDCYSSFDSSGGVQKGNRVSVTGMLKTTKTTLVTVWMPEIVVLYPKTSAEYMALFPKGLSPFNSKGIDARIAAYNTLTKNIGSDPALATIKTAITTAYTNLLAARATQTGSKTNTKGVSGTLDTLRIDAMEMQYRNLGNIMDNFFDTRETLCPLLFDLVTLRVNPQTIYTGKLAASVTKAVLANTFVATGTMTVKLTVDSKLYLSNTIGGTNSTPIAVPADIKTVVDVVGFGVTDYASFRFLTIVNQATVAGKYSVTLD